LRPSDSSSGYPGVEVSVALPAYNEERTIEETIETTLDRLESFLPAGSFEVLIAEDGCEDRTPEIAARFAEEDKRVRHIHSDERLGRGGALEYAFDAAYGDVLAYFDADLSTDIKHLEELIGRIRSGEYDVATGSRWMPGQHEKRPAKRRIPSRGYNFFVRLFLRSGLRDHQCGFKTFSREAFESLRDDIKDEHWFWDTEILVHAQRNGFSVKEFPVDWTPKEDTKVDLVGDIFGMGGQILRTWWQLSISPRVNRRVTIGVEILFAVTALGLMVLYIDPEAVLGAFSGTNPALVAVAAAIYVIPWPLRGLRYQAILAELGFHERAGFLTGAVFISQTGNLVFPARAGDAIRAYILKACRDIPYPSGFASLAAERVFDLLTITVIAGAVLVGLVATGGVGDLAAAISGGVPQVSAGAVRTAVTVAAGVGAAAVATVGAILFSARSERNLVQTGISSISSDAYADPAAAVIEQFVNSIQTLAVNRGAFVRIGLSSLVIWSLDVGTAILVLAAFPDVSLSLPLLIAVGSFAVSVGNLAKVLPLSPGGIGLYEAAFTAFVFGLTGGAVPTAVAFAAAVLDHAVKNVITVIGGVASMLSLNVSLKTAVHETDKVHDTSDVTHD
jgi:uncharacterized membrane protein YbhN (UPF0104 family)